MYIVSVEVTRYNRLKDVNIIVPIHSNLLTTRQPQVYVFFVLPITNSLKNGP